MDFTEEEIHGLIRSIFGSSRTRIKKGYIWLTSRHTSNPHSASRKEKNIIYKCLLSKRLQTTCEFHKRTHDGK